MIPLDVVHNALICALKSDQFRCVDVGSLHGNRWSENDKPRREPFIV